MFLFVFVSSFPFFSSTFPFFPFVHFLVPFPVFRFFTFSLLVSIFNFHVFPILTPFHFPFPFLPLSPPYRPLYYLLRFVRADQIVYNMQNVFNLLPNLNVEELVRSMLVKTNDMHLVIYVSALIRSVIALHDLVNNKVRCVKLRGVASRLPLYRSCLCVFFIQRQ